MFMDKVWVRDANYLRTFESVSWDSVASLITYLLREQNSEYLL
jgi:hypothetical protein